MPEYRRGPFVKVLVTGGAGFVGSHLARRLLGLGYTVDVVDNLGSGQRENVGAECTFHELDLAEANCVRQLPPGPYAAVAHLAGQSSGEKSFEDPVVDLDWNGRATVLLARWAIERRVPVFLYASSMGVYGAVGTEPVNEETAPRPVSFYGASKLYSEHALGLFGRMGLRTCCFRMFNVYGPGQNLANMKQGMVSIYLAYLLRGEPILVKGSLDRVRDFVYVDDVVDAWVRALQGNAAGVFNVGTGRGTTVRELIAELLLACDAPSDYPIRIAEGTPGDLFAMTADITAIWNALGWEPRIPLREGLRRMADWARGGGKQQT